MLDLRLIRRDPDAVRAALARRGTEAAAAVDHVLELDQRWRALTAEAEELRAEQNRASRGRRGPPTPEEREQLAALAARGRELSDQETAVRAELDAALAGLPNLPADDAPDEDTVLREVGQAGAHRPRPPGAGRPADRHGASGAHVGLALRLSCSATW